MVTVTLNNEQLTEILIELMRTNPGMPVELAAEKKGAIGVFVPYYVSQREDRPKITQERKAELERQLATIDDSVTHEEMVRLVMEDLRATTPES